MINTWTQSMALPVWFCDVLLRFSLSLRQKRWDVLHHTQSGTEQKHVAKELFDRWGKRRQHSHPLSSDVRAKLYLPPQDQIRQYFHPLSSDVRAKLCHPSLVPRLTWKSVGRTNPPGAGNFTLVPDNSIFFNGDHYKWVFIGIVHTRRGFWRWCHSLTFIGCPARTSFIPPRVCNFVLATVGEWNDIYE